MTLNFYSHSCYFLFINILEITLWERQEVIFKFFFLINFIDQIEIKDYWLLICLIKFSNY